MEKVAAAAQTGKTAKGGAKSALMSVFDSTVAIANGGKRGQKGQDFSSVLSEKVVNRETVATKPQKNQKESTNGSELAASYWAAYQAMAPSIADKRGVVKVTGESAGLANIKRIQFHTTENNVIVQAKGVKTAAPKEKQENVVPQDKGTEGIIKGEAKSAEVSKGQQGISKRAANAAENSNMQGPNKPAADAGVNNSKPVTEPGLEANANKVPVDAKAVKAEVAVKAAERLEKHEAKTEQGSAKDQVVTGANGQEKTSKVKPQSEPGVSAVKMENAGHEKETKSAGEVQNGGPNSVNFNFDISGSVQIKEHTAAKADNNGAISAIDAVGLEEQIGGPISAAINRTGQSVTVTLNPPELGRLSIKFEEQGGELIGRIEFENAAVGEKLEQSLPRVIQNLQDSGVAVREVELVYKGQEQGYNGTADNGELYNGGGRDFEGQHQESQLQESGYTQASQDISEVSESRSYINETGVNVWI